MAIKRWKYEKLVWEKKIGLDEEGDNGVWLEIALLRIRVWIIGKIVLWGSVDDTWEEIVGCLV